MAPSLSISLSPVGRQRLLDIARKSIAHGLVNHEPLTIARDDMPGVLGDPLGSFVTLRQESLLRGCIGSIEALRPLAEAVARAAFSAAFRDARFPRLREAELQLTTIEISVLSALEHIEAESEAALLDSLVPGVDGLLLEDGWRRATFLPKVWEQLSEPTDFLRSLKQKAGLTPDYWSESIGFCRYRTLSFSDLPPVRSATA